MAQLFSLGHSVIPDMSIPFDIDCCEGWCDITDEVEVADAPWTLAKPDGVGAFQFSIATYKSGRIPDPTPESLLFLLRDFAISHELGEPADIVTEAGELRIAAGSFRQGDSFIRAWIFRTVVALRGLLTPALSVSSRQSCQIASTWSGH